MRRTAKSLRRNIGRSFLRLACYAGVLMLSACGNVTSDPAPGRENTAPFAWAFSTTTDGHTVYVPDTSNHVIRTIDLASGAVRVLAGKQGTPGTDDGIGESARFNLPKGVAIVGPHVLVADSANFTVRKIVLATGEVTTLAGSPGQ